MAETLLIGATIASAATSVMGGVAANKAAKAEAAMERNKAKAEAARQAKQTRYRAGLALANTAASGLQLEGSPLDIMESNAVNAEMDRLNILAGGENRAAMAEYQGKVAKRTGYLKAGTSLLTGGSKAYSL